MVVEESLKMECFYYKMWQRNHMRMNEINIELRSVNREYIERRFFKAHRFLNKEAILSCCNLGSHTKKGKVRK